MANWSKTTGFSSQYENEEYLEEYTCYEATQNEEDMSESNVNHSSKSSASKRKKPSRIFTKEEKKQVALLVHKEPLIWDLNEPLHSNYVAMGAAWDRISKAMETCKQSECKLVWKSLRDSARYHFKRKQGQTGDSPDEDQEISTKWEFEEYMHFIKPVATKYPRKTTVLGLQSLSTESSSSTATADDTMESPSDSNEQVIIFSA